MLFFLKKQKNKRKKNARSLSHKRKLRQLLTEISMEIRKTESTSQASSTNLSAMPAKEKASIIGSLFKAPSRPEIRKHSFKVVEEGSSKVLQAAKRLFKL